MFHLWDLLPSPDPLEAKVSHRAGRTRHQALVIRRRRARNKTARISRRRNRR